MFYHSIAIFSTLLVAVSAVPKTQTGAYDVQHGQWSSLGKCLKGRGVPLSPGPNANLTTLVEPYNLQLRYTPAAIVFPETPQHVSDAVSCAAALGIKVQPRSGGHSYASYSLGGKDGSLVVDLSSFQDVTLDQETGIVKVGGGVRLGNLALAIFKQGQRGLPHGTCPG